MITVRKATAAEGLCSCCDSTDAPLQYAVVVIEGQFFDNTTMRRPITTTLGLCRRHRHMAAGVLKIFEQQDPYMDPNKPAKKTRRR